MLVQTIEFRNSTIAGAVVLVALCLVGTFVHAVDAPAEVTALPSLGEINLGAFCITDIPPGTLRIGEGRGRQQGAWWEVFIDITKGAARNGNEIPRLYFFDKPMPQGAGLTTCRDWAENGASVLEGNLNWAKIEAQYYIPYGIGSTRWQIDPRKLEVELGMVKSNVNRVLGARVDFAGRLVWAVNPRTVLVAPDQDRYDAILRVGSTDLVLAGAHLRFGETPSDSEIVVDLENNFADGRIRFNLDVSSGEMQLFEGILRAGESSGSAMNWQAAGLDFSSSELRSKRLKVDVKSHEIVATFDDLEIQCEDLFHEGVPSFRVDPSGPINATALSAMGTQTQDDLSLATFVWKDLVMEGEHVSVLRADATSSLQGAARIELSSLSDTRIEGSADFPDPDISALTVLALIENPENLHLNLSGLKNALAVDGGLEYDNLSFGKLLIDSPLLQPLTFRLSDSGDVGQARFEVGIKIDSAGAMFKMGDQTGVDGEFSLQTELLELDLGFAIVLGDGPDNPRLEISKGEFSAGIAATATNSPVLFGAPIAMAGVSASVSVPSPVTVTANMTDGSIDVSVDGIVATGGEMTFSAEDQTTFRIESPLSTSAGATVGIDLASGRYHLREASFVLNDLVASSSAATGVDVAGMQVTSPRLSIGLFELKVHDSEGRFTLQDLRFEADSITIAGPPMISLESAPGLEIPRLEARLFSDQTSALAVLDARAFNLDIEVPKATFVSPDGFRIVGRAASLVAEEVALDRVTGKIHIEGGSLAVASPSENVTGSATFREFDLSIVKTPDDLTGDGSIHIESLKLEAKDRLEVGQCSNNDQWKLKAIAEFGGSDIILSLSEDHLSGTAQLSSGSVEIADDGYSRCEWDEDIVLWEKQEAVVDIPCFNGWEIHNCRHRITLVPEARAKIHWVAELHDLSAKARFSDISVALDGDNGVRVCPEKITLDPPYIVANYHPNVRSSSVPIVGNLLRDLIRGAATLFESTLASSLGTNAAALVYLQQTLFPPVCYGG